MCGRENHDHSHCHLTECLFTEYQAPAMGAPSVLRGLWEVGPVIITSISHANCLRSKPLSGGATIQHLSLCHKDNLGAHPSTATPLSVFGHIPELQFFHL